MAEKLNGPGFGARMAMAVAQAPSFEGLKESLAEVQAQSARAQDAFRQLLSYCNSRADDENEWVLKREAYGDVAAKLRNMLDGE